MTLTDKQQDIRANGVGGVRRGADGGGVMTGTVLHDVPFEDYIAPSDEISSTQLKDISVSPLLYAHRLKAGRQDKDSLRLGRACHTSVLEPDKFALEFAVHLKKNGIRRGDKWETFKAANDGRTILVEAQYYQAVAIRNAVRNHRVAGELLSRTGRAEVTLKWTHPRTGVKVKCRLDWLCDELVDLKTTRNPAPHKFSGDAARLGYDLQLALYADAVAACGMGAMSVKIIAAQNCAPWDVVVFDVDEAMLTEGRRKYEAAIDTYIACRESKSWPGMAPDRAVPLHLPAWATPEAEEEQLTINGESLF